MPNLGKWEKGEKVFIPEKSNGYLNLQNMDLINRYFKEIVNGK